MSPHVLWGALKFFACAVPLIMNRVAEEITELNLSAHPEGGIFRVVEEGPVETISSIADPRRIFSHIYFALRSGEVSRLHKLDCYEIIHFYGGSRVFIVELVDAELPPRITILGDNASTGDRRVCYVGLDTWFGAFLEDGGSCALLGCTTVPGYEELIFGDRASLLREYPLCSEMIMLLT